MVELLTIVYGDKHIDLFEKCTLRSLSFHFNQQTLLKQKAVWNIFTQTEDMEKIRGLFDHSLSSLKVNIQSMDKLLRYSDPVQSALVWQIEECIKNDSLFLMAPPDTFFSDRSIEALIKIPRKKGDCVAVAHPRVHGSFLNETLSAPNDMLVQHAFKHLHRSWSDAEKDHPFNNTFIGGVEWQEIVPCVYSISHRLPTVYVCSFLPQDLEYFKLCTSSGDFDHVWPKELIKQNRYNYLGSSDAAFIVEITDKDKNVPPISSGQPTDGSFWQQHDHNIINNMFNVIFRSTTQRSY